MNTERVEWIPALWRRYIYNARSCDCHPVPLTCVPVRAVTGVVADLVVTGGAVLTGVGVAVVPHDVTAMALIARRTQAVEPTTHATNSASANTYLLKHDKLTLSRHSCYLLIHTIWAKAENSYHFQTLHLL